MIELRKINKTYQMGQAAVHALDDVSVSIKDGEFVAVIGPSGSGKSTLMNVIGCLDLADDGEYILNGQHIDDYSERELGVIRNKEIGFIFQQFNLLAKLTAYENVELPLIYQGLGMSERKKRVTESLAKVGLSDRMRHRPNELSGGQQQRVAIARALSTHPTLILADEPTGNLDSKSGIEIMNILVDLHKEGRGIVLITHDEYVAEKATRRLHMLDGRIDKDTGKAGERA
ncbi:MAG: ABC transporter ATP-binding protein [Clostridia bacterium]|jgi:putative ABC transport system ATP-binding protein|nr:ABC transporter ATP-binding protein [Clostridia bacterium]